MKRAGTIQNSAGLLFLIDFDKFSNLVMTQDQS